MRTITRSEGQAKQMNDAVDEFVDFYLFPNCLLLVKRLKLF